MNIIKKKRIKEFTKDDEVAKTNKAVVEIANKYNLGI